MNIAIIPARGGSKRIPRKNIKDFCGKPMIAWSIQAAQASGCFERIIVSTDDAYIAEVARQYGAETPFTRPAELADDFAGTLPVMRHAVNWLAGSGIAPNYVCCIYATAPFLQAADFAGALHTLEQQHCDYVFSITEYAAPIQRAFRITAQGRISMFDPAQFNTRSQDLEPAYHDAGQFYWGKTAAWQQEKPLFGEYSAPFVLSRQRVQDIDTPQDWLYAELMFRLLHSDRQ